MPEDGCLQGVLVPFGTSARVFGRMLCVGMNADENRVKVYLKRILPKTEIEPKH